MPKLTLAGLVLAGGRSSRFGADKAVQRLAGRPLLAWSLAALDTLCARVAVSAPADSPAAALAAALGRTVLADEAGHAAGPLAGVAAGLAWAAEAGYAGLVTLPCDTPLIDAATLAVLARAASETGAAFAATADGPQALCAVWPTAAGAQLSRRLAEGEHPAVRHVLRELRAREVRFEDPAPFRNLNTPADLAAIEAALARGV